MNGLNALVLSLCTSFVFIGVLFIIAPEGNMKKSVSFLLSLVFLISIVSLSGIGIKKIDINFEFKESEIENDDLKVSAAKIYYKTLLENAGLEYKNIEIITNKSPDGDISIIKVLINTSENAQAIRQLISENSSDVEVEIINE